MSRSPLSHLASLLAVILDELGDARTVRSLADAVERPRQDVEAALRELEKTGVALCVPGGVRWRIAKEHLLLTDIEDCRREIESNGDSPLERAFAQFRRHRLLDGAEQMLALVERVLSASGDSGAAVLLDLCVAELGKWSTEGRTAEQIRRYPNLVLTIQGMALYLPKCIDRARQLEPVAREAATLSGDTRALALLDLVGGCFGNVAPRHDPAASHAMLTRGIKAIQKLGDADITARAANFLGLLHYLQGDFEQVLVHFEIARQYPQMWKSRYFTEQSSIYTSTAAMYLGRFPLALGILESSRPERSARDKAPVAAWWRMQMAMVLLYMGRLEDALEHLDFVICSASYEAQSRIVVWAFRGLAYYHYLHGRIGASYRVLRNAIRTGHRYHIHRPISFYPWMLDLLYAYERAGFEPIPGNELERELEGIFTGPNRQMHGAALRIRALQQRERGEGPETVLQTQQRSLDLFEKVGNAFEAAHVRLDMADTLDVMGRHEHAGECRKTAHEVILSWQQGSFIGPQQGTEREEGSGVVERCVAALEALPNCETLDAHLTRLTRVAQKELGAERVTLYRLDPPDRLVCRADSNNDHPGNGLPDEKRRWLLLNLQGRQPVGEEQREWCIPLRVREGERWLLHFDNTYALGYFTKLSPVERNKLSFLFSMELRMAIRLYALRQQDIVESQGRLQATQQHDGAEATLYYGESMQELLEQARQAAATDATILILGETGVGKEHLARRVHALSGRPGLFVPVHPASTPESLFESEFFGHEKGAFTGAIKQKAGFFELADQGTLFIDEVGDIPMSIQTKLIRVLQEKTFFRVGGTRSIHSNFRLAAATNRNLWKEVREGRFREDLYYRISVIPFTLPPLRERPYDIPVLARMFVDYFSKRYQRPDVALTPEDLHRLQSYPWPGNVREMKSVIERAVILSTQGHLDFALPRRQEPSAIETSAPVPLLTNDLPTLEELKRRYIRHVLTLTQGRICGPDGAETLLGMKRSTLYAKLHEYGLANEKKWKA